VSDLAQRQREMIDAIEDEIFQCLEQGAQLPAECTIRVQYAAMDFPCNGTTLVVDEHVVNLEFGDPADKEITWNDH
jgi:hypothetical protein